MEQDTKLLALKDYLTQPGTIQEEDTLEYELVETSRMDFDDWLTSREHKAREVYDQLMNDDDVDPKLRRQLAVDILTMSGRIGQKDKGSGNTFVFSDEAVQHLTGALGVFATAFNEPKEAEKIGWSKQTEDVQDVQDGRDK